MTMEAGGSAENAAEEDKGFRAAGGMIFKQDSSQMSPADAAFAQRMSASTQNFSDRINAEKMRSAQLAYQKAMADEKKRSTEEETPSSLLQQGDWVVTDYGGDETKLREAGGIPDGSKGKVLGVKSNGTCVVKFRDIGARPLGRKLVRKLESTTNEGRERGNPAPRASTSKGSSLSCPETDAFSWSLTDFLAAQGMNKGAATTTLAMLESVAVYTLGDLAVSSAEALTQTGVKLLQARRLIAEANSMLLKYGDQNGTDGEPANADLPSAVAASVSEKRATKGEKHPDTLQALSNLALLMMDQVSQVVGEIRPVQIKASDK
jgi:hypothetical protein